MMSVDSKVLSARNDLSDCTRRGEPAAPTIAIALLVVPKSRPTASTLAAVRALETSFIMGLTIKARRTLVNVEHRAYTRQTLRMWIVSGRDFPRPHFFQARARARAQEEKH